MPTVENIERINEKIELKDNKTNIIKKELKDVNYYDEPKIQFSPKKNPEIRKNNKEKAERRLLDTISLTYE